MIKNYIITALRNLYRNKIYSSINILGLSIGLACSMLIILYVKDELSFDRFHENVDRVYRIVSDEVDVEGNVTNKNSHTGALQGPLFAEHVPEIQTYVRIQSQHMDIRIDNEIKSEELFKVDKDFFKIFSFPMISGNPETCLTQPFSIVLSQDMAIKIFGTTDVLGRSVMLKDGQDFQPYQVTGVAKNTPINSTVRFNILIPQQLDESELSNRMNWFNFFQNTFVLLAKNADLTKVEEKMDAFYKSDSKEARDRMAKEYGMTEAMENYKLQQLTDIHLNTELPAQNGLTSASNPMYSYLLSGIALFILLIACINFINLTVARSVKRSREIGIRKVIGGERRQLIIQFLSESFVLCGFAFLLAILLLKLSLPVFNNLGNKALSFSYLLDLKLILGYLLLFVITGFLAGFYPAIVLSGYNPVETLYSRFNIGGKNYLQKSLVVFQFILASFMIMATLVIYSQFNLLTEMELGYNDQNLVEVSKYPFERSELETFTEQLKKDQSIIDISGKNGGSWFTAAKVNGETILQFSIETVDENFIPMMEIPVIQGRNFSRDFPSDSSNSVLVNETFAKEAGWKDPIGETVNFWYNDNEKYQVIGVVKDYHFQSLTNKIRPQLFTMNMRNEMGKVFIKINPEKTTNALEHIESTFKTLYPNDPYNYVFTEEQNLRSYEQESKWKQIMLFGALLTIFVSCIGLFGLTVLAAEKRTKEIGIRKVLGASVNTVVATLTKDFLKLVILALIVAIPITWLTAGKWLDNYPYRIEINWQLFVIAGILILLIAVTTISFQAVKAAVSNPVKSLRTE
ncbi:ABC transporter permease [Robertkochia solimangrovi]|uniref:ABC transporter permease n=1 Tax=Robertkochia solimangrovi TaxID=2213046 RepID=UPI00117C7D1D|nr:ABC transporter permease [Robertkochia solimangrovi]TRZ45726.1 ABC transporter permease [Robertkochia solimangrovi]